MKRFQFSLRTLLIATFVLALLMFPYNWMLRPPRHIRVIDNKGKPVRYALLEFVDRRKAVWSMVTYNSTDENGVCIFPAEYEQLSVFRYLFRSASRQVLVVTLPYGSDQKWYFTPEYEYRSGEAYGLIRLPPERVVLE